MRQNDKPCNYEEVIISMGELHSGRVLAYGAEDHGSGST